MQNIAIAGVLLIIFLVLIVVLACIGLLAIFDTILDWRDAQHERRNRINNADNQYRMAIKSDREISGLALHNLCKMSNCTHCEDVLGLSEHCLKFMQAHNHRILKEVDIYELWKEDREHRRY